MEHFGNGGACGKVWQTAEHDPPSAAQVTNANFKEALPAVKQALEDCEFYAFDLEMTGLHMRDGAPPYLDEMEDRYRQVRSPWALLNLNL